MTNSSDHSERIHEMDVPTGIAVVRAGPSGTGSIEGSRVMTDQSATTLAPKSESLGANAGLTQTNGLRV